MKHEAQSRAHPVPLKKKNLLYQSADWGWGLGRGGRFVLENLIHLERVIDGDNENEPDRMRM